ncbi:MAG: aminopeptidase P family protein [Roseibium sp.]|nr:aminopeptidase P family protein [Roseibium sp.]
MVEPDFPASEFEQRLESAQREMRAQDLQALLFTTEPEVRYFSGFRTQFWQSPTRPWFLVVPARGKPVAVIPAIGADLMGRTWLDDIRVFTSPHERDDGISVLTGVLDGYARIGMPMGRETSLRMPLADFDRLRASLPGSEFTDATGLIQGLRMVKSGAEIGVISDICAIASNAFQKANDLFYAGQALTEAFRAFKIELLAQGADDVPYLVGGAGSGGYSDVISPPTDQCLQAGDILMLDTGANLTGYFCDFDRNFAIGHASDEVRTAYRTLIAATDAAADRARPGATCAALFQTMALCVGGGSDVGRYGHGLGMQLTEAPSIISFDQTVLQEGMVLTLEPSIALSNGKMLVHEENIVIRDGPPDFLTRRASPDLPVLDRARTGV